VAVPDGGCKPRQRALTNKADPNCYFTAIRVCNRQQADYFFKTIIFTTSYSSMERKIYNPIQKDEVVFLKTAADTDGDCTLVEVTLAAGGGVGLHYHKTYSEKFDCLEGEVQVQLGKKLHSLKPGESATAAPNINHFFRNRSGKPAKFRVELRPASRGFEESLQVGYGLASDGLCKPNGFPKDKLALAWLFDISESNLPGWMSVFEFILRRQAKKARAKGIDRQLTEKYVRF
jgi:quercetin dioxygenase-like cupin family protein